MASERDMAMNFIHRTILREETCGKTVLVTGASDGIGACLVKRLASAGARVILVARNEEKLEAVVDFIRQRGGEAHYYIADLSDIAQVEVALERIGAEQPPVDILVCNAGRSIRRSIIEQTDRFHDFQRLMQLNYFGAVRMILGLLPRMVERKSGHIIHISSYSVPMRTPCFGGYAGSKSAVDSLLQCMAPEVRADGVYTSSIYLPLVETKMVDSSKLNHWSKLSLDQACAKIERVIFTREQELMEVKARALAIVYVLLTHVVLYLNMWIFKAERRKNASKRELLDVEAGQKAKPVARKKRGCCLAMFAWWLSTLDYLNNTLIFLVFLSTPLIAFILGMVRHVALLVFVIFAGVSFFKGLFCSRHARLVHDSQPTGESQGSCAGAGVDHVDAVSDDRGVQRLPVEVNV